MNDLLPITFRRFSTPLEKLALMNPIGIALAGSYGNPKKIPDKCSDLDILFVFDNTNVLSILRHFESEIASERGLVYTHLGAHPQFGHLVNLFFADDPLRWIDVGIMDENFSRNYLTGQPITVIKGFVDTSGIPPSANSQLSHLAKKIMKTKQRNDITLMIVYSYRYVQWASMHVNEGDVSGSVVERVLNDVRLRFPQLIENMKP